MPAGRPHLSRRRRITEGKRAGTKGAVSSPAAAMHEAEPWGFAREWIPFPCASLRPGMTRLGPDALRFRRSPVLTPSTVIPGLVPGTHAFNDSKDVGGRDEPGPDALVPWCGCAMFSLCS